MLLLVTHPVRLPMLAFAAGFIGLLVGYVAFNTTLWRAFYVPSSTLAWRTQTPRPRPPSSPALCAYAFVSGLY